MAIQDSPEWKFFNPTIFLYLARFVFINHYISHLHVPQCVPLHLADRAGQVGHQCDRAGEAAQGAGAAQGMKELALKYAQHLDKTLTERHKNVVKALLRQGANVSAENEVCTNVHCSSTHMLCVDCACARFAAYLCRLAH